MTELPPEKQALKVATRRLVAAVGGQEAAVLFTRFTRHQALSDFGNPAPEHAHRFAPIDAVADMESISHGTPGHPVVTRQLARLAGYALVPLPRPRGEAADFAGHLQAVIRESADVTVHLSSRLRTAPSPEDVGTLRREVAEAIQALVELDAALAGLGGE